VTLTLCAVATCSLRLSVASVLLRLATVSGLRAVLALAVLLTRPAKLALRTSVLLLTTVAALLLSRRGRSVTVLTLRGAAVLATRLV
jgi:hypothetical protein